MSLLLCISLGCDVRSVSTQRSSRTAVDGLHVASSAVLTYGSNVKEVTTQVSEGAVDCSGICN